MFLGNVAASILLPSKSCTRSARYQRDEPSTQGRCSRGQLARGVLTDARGERFTPSHAVKKGRRYRYYVSTALITEAGTDQSQGWRLPAQEIEDAVIRVLADALTSPALLIERFGTAIPSDQTRKMLDRAIRLAAVLKRSPAERAKVVRDLIEKVVIEENAITIRMRCSSLSGGASRATLIGESERQPNRAYSACGLPAPRY